MISGRSNYMYWALSELIYIIFQFVYLQNLIFIFRIILSRLLTTAIIIIVKSSASVWFSTCMTLRSVHPHYNPHFLIHCVQISILRKCANNVAVITVSVIICISTITPNARQLFNNPIRQFMCLRVIISEIFHEPSINKIEI
jgi:hypothetical protein